ncbi:MAG: hypothetical protein V1690_03195 [Candidatus Moraniibacteriota bacterium]
MNDGVKDLILEPVSLNNGDSIRDEERGICQEDSEFDSKNPYARLYQEGKARTDGHCPGSDFPE